MAKAFVDNGQHLMATIATTSAQAASAWFRGMSAVVKHQNPVHYVRSLGNHVMVEYQDILVNGTLLQKPPPTAMNTFIEQCGLELREVDWIRAFLEDYGSKSQE